MARKLKHRLSNAGRTVFLYGETDKIQEFFPQAEVMDEDNTVVKTVQFRGGIRRRFPGGPGTSYGGGARSVLFGPPAALTTLPGHPIKCEITEGIGPLRRTTVRQFTLQGSFTKLWQIARATTTISFVLRSPNGEAKRIGPVLAGGND
ncbi:MAG: hypothetical protein ACK57J_22675 [Rubrivivax sp.]|jgi:hypothetical protein